MSVCTLNKTKRAALNALIDAYETARSDLADHLSDLENEWREAWEAKSEKWQDSEAGDAAKERLDNLAGAVELIADAFPWDADGQ